MPRIRPIDPETATGRAKELLNRVERTVGGTPSLIRAMAQSPATLDGYLSLSTALSGGVLNACLREQIALAAADNEQDDQCACAHAHLACSVGVSNDDLVNDLLDPSIDPRMAAVLTFARAIVKERGFVDDQAVEAARAAGLGDPEITEIIANVALNIFTNYFVHVAKAEIDFPVVDAGTAQQAG